MLNAIVNILKRIGRAFDPAQSPFSLTPTGRVRPLPEKPAYVRTPWPARRTSIIGLIVFAVAYFIVDYFFDLDHLLEAAIRGFWQTGAPQLIWNGIEIAFFLFLTVTAVRLAGRVFWGIRRLHDLGRPALHIAPDLAWVLAAILPVIAIAHGLDTMMQLPAERSSLLASYLAALALWLAPFYMAFWSQHLKSWNATVETAPGDPSENRYGPPPSPASEPR